MTTTRPRKKKPEDLDQTQLNNIDMSPEDWEEFGRGVQLFNNGKFWHSHEAWEQIWIRHSEDERLFFQGMIQMAAAYHQLVGKKSFRGLLHNFDKALQKLAVFEPEYLGISLAPVVRLMKEGKQEIERLGAEGLGGFDYKLIPKLRFQKPLNPDLLVESRSIVMSERFREAVTLFNRGYHWEAHEVWEDVWRDEEAEAKDFALAFVQVAAANNFITLAKYPSALYVFEKAFETFSQFAHLNCGVDIEKIIQELESVLERLRHTNGHPSDRKQLMVNAIVLKE